MTALERTILALFALDVEALIDTDVKAAVGAMSGQIAEAIDRLRRNSQTPIETWASEYDIMPEIEAVRTCGTERRRLLLLNLSKWLSNRAVECNVLAGALDAAARGSASECVAQMRRSKYRRGSAKEVE